VRTDIVFATMTLARRAEEGAILTGALAQLTGYGRPVVGADGGSTPDALQQLASIRGLELVPSRYGPGLVPQVRTAIEAAAAMNTPFICYTEPDKQEFFGAGLSTFLDASPADSDVGVVVAARTASAFGTFPPVQQYTERAINDLTGGAIGLRGDYSYGPFLMSTSLAPHVAAAPTDLGWGWRHYVFATAHRLGFRVVLVPGGFECPLDQREEDQAERLHRVRQLEENCRGLAAAFDAPLGPGARTLY
jgi:hypothetical protein